ncbi:hypothetical protein AB0A77_01970 [Streptomyces varsoviensis]|uniref:hypothetical protein n=1 Tax=Streptomyces varsoviensis TaxID=67373 RepID=UPI0033D30056
MDPYISHVPRRRVEWKGHATKKGVRQAIAWDRGRGRLSIFELNHAPGGPIYTIVPSEEWTSAFAD